MLKLYQKHKWNQFSRRPEVQSPSPQDFVRQPITPIRLVSNAANIQIEPIKPMLIVPNAVTVPKKQIKPIPQESWGPVSQSPRLLGNWFYCFFWYSYSILQLWDWFYWFYWYSYSIFNDFPQRAETSRPNTTLWDSWGTTVMVTITTFSTMWIDAIDHTCSFASYFVWGT